jgi:outer membrane lipoprotein-sorting protein
MNILRRTSTVRLVLAVIVIAVVSAATAYAVSTRSGARPPARSLPAAIHTALAGKPVNGVTARIAFTDHLFQSGLPASASQPLVTGASGRLWAGGGRVRLELQASTGDTEIGYDGRSLTVYDVASNTAYVLVVHQGGSWQPYRPNAGARQIPTVSDIKAMLQHLLQHVAVTGPVPTNIGGQPAYTVRISPKHSAGLLGSVELGWDASHGIPLKVAVYSQGDSTPVLALKATSISFGAVPASDLRVSLAPGAKIVHVTAPAHVGAAGNGKHPEVTGAAAVARALSFPLAAPSSLVGVPRQTVRLVTSSASKGAMVVYGHGLGAILVLEEPLSGGAQSHSPLSALPSVSIHGASAHELATALGTAIQWDRGGVRYTLIGSLPAPAAEAAARAIG